jgi:hypothetical protein
MRALIQIVRSFGLTLVLAAMATAQAVPQTIPQVPPPTLISPMLNVGVPILFQWTPVNPGNVYNFVLQSRSRLPQAVGGPLAVTYELQISDYPDVASHILVDLTTQTTIFSFQNQNVPGSGFTSQQTPNLPLSGGTYYWRVRAIIGNTSDTAFSSIGRFALNLGGGGGASTPVHDMGITSLVLTTPAYVGAATVIVASVQNSGTFAEESVPLTITANGTQLAKLVVPPTTSGQTTRVTTIWTPTVRGIAQVSALISFTGPTQNRRSHRSIRTCASSRSTSPRSPGRSASDRTATSSPIRAAARPRSCSRRRAHRSTSARSSAAPSSFAERSRSATARS